MSPHMKGMFGAVVISQPMLDIVTVVNKNGKGQVVIFRFAIATPRDIKDGVQRFNVIAFTGKDFKTGKPRDLGNAPSLVGAMALRESIIADYVRESDEAKRANFRFSDPLNVRTTAGWYSAAAPSFPGSPIR